MKKYSSQSNPGSDHSNGDDCYGFDIDKLIAQENWKIQNDYIDPVIWMN